MMSKTDGWILRLGLGLLVASLFLFMSPSCSHETSMEEQAKITMSSQRSGGGSSNSSGDWDFRHGSGNDSGGNWTYSWGKGSGPDGSTISYGSGSGRNPDGSRFGYGWGSSSSAGYNGNPANEGGSAGITGPGLGIGCACGSGSSTNADGSNNGPMGSVVAGEDP
ncbi:hypothetical protein DITRI_Ditri03aG0155600 [Diplodiscus trichospermus]